MPIAGGLAMGAGAGEASERARAAGASQEDRNKAALLGAGVGISEILPIRLGPLAKALDRTDSLSRLKRIFAAGGLEALQEAAANTAQNLIEQGYNPERGTFEGSGEAAAYGGGVGGLVQAIIDLVIPGRFSKKTSIGDETKIVEEADTVEEASKDLVPVGEVKDRRGNRPEEGGGVAEGVGSEPESGGKNVGHSA